MTEDEMKAKYPEMLHARPSDRIAAATLMIGILAAPDKTEDPIFDAKVKHIYDELDSILTNRSRVEDDDDDDDEED